MVKILIVDDENQVVQQLTALIRSFGYQPFSTLYPTALFEVLKRESADLILLDINMPELDGVTLLKQLKAHADYQPIPVIMLTADTNREILKECFLSGAVDYINKPLDQVVLQARIQSALMIQDSLKKLERSGKELKELLSIQQSLNDDLIKTTEELERTQQHLIHTQKMKALGTLAGGLGHDFNNILAIILGNTDLLLDQYSKDAKSQKSLKDIEQAVQRGKNIVKQLLSFTVVEGQSHAPIQILSTVEVAIEIARTMCSSNIEIQENLCVECPFILGDSSQIQQALVNIFVNAREAMEKQGGVLTITLEVIDFEEHQQHVPELTEGTYVHLMIQDTGHGMSPEIQEHIFDPFYTTRRLGGTHMGSSKEGTGLGLSVVYHIIQSHHGAIKVDSEVEEGTTVHLYFPAYQENIPTESMQETPLEKTPLAKSVALRKIRILVADDEVELTETYAFAFELEGYEVMVCHDGEEALEAFRAQPEQFDLVFTDQEMPKMLGTELSQELLKIRPDIPIMLATGYSPLVNEANFKDFGIQKFFMKPMDFNKFLQSLKDLIANIE